MRAKGRSKSAAKHPAAHPTPTRRHGVPILEPESGTDEAPDQPFADGVADELDPDLRHRLISEAAFHHQAERGYNSDYEDEDWRDAEGEVDHVVLNPKPDKTPDE
jgi:hypothetical protein